MQQMMQGAFMGTAVTPGAGAGKPFARPSFDRPAAGAHAGRMPQDRALVNAHCSTLPGAKVSDPWGGGHDTWKIGGKLFAVIGSMDGGVSVKCADIETAQLLIEMGRAERAPYFHRSWVFLRWGRVSDDEMRERLGTSYAIIRASLPKKVQAGLDPA